MRRSSLGGSTQDLRLRVIECLNRLADRDTLAIAAAELDGIARALTEDSFAAFLACLHNTDASARAPVRKHCVSLLAVLSESHGDSLSPFVARMVATVLRRIRDPDTAVRTACVEAAAAMSARITRPPFAAAFLRPLVEAMATEQDAGAQTGAALCLAAAIEAAPEPDAAQLRRSLPRLGKLARSEGFKAKAAVLALIGSVVGAGGASSSAVLDWLVPAVVEFLSSEDWAVRKAAAEALGRVAAAERDLAEKHRDSCLTALETRRFDKVKVVRETMNHTLELWKDVSSGSSEEIPSPTQSRSSTSTDNGIGRCSPPLLRSSQDSSFKTPQRKKSTVPTNRSPQSDSDGSSRSGVKKGSAVSNDTSPTSTVSSKVVDHPKKKPLSNWKIEISVPSSHSSKVARDDSHDKKKNNNEAVPELGAKHALFIKTREERGHRFGGLRAGSRVVPFDDYDDDDDNNEKKQGLDVLDCSATEEALDSQKDAEDLCLIREQLLQIENQQSSLLDLLQRFIGSSQSGLSSLETRVNGIEIALEEMSYNMAVSSGRIPNTESTDNACCKLPGADFLSSKFWRRAEGRYSSQRFSSSGTISSLNRDCGGELYKSEGHRFQHRNGGAFVPSPLADAHINSRDLRNRLPKGIIEDSGSVQACNANGFNRA